MFGSGCYLGVRESCGHYQRVTFAQDILSLADDLAIIEACQRVKPDGNNI